MMQPNIYVYQVLLCIKWLVCR